MKVVALASLKGGVGKTSTAVNLAALAATQGASVLLWDLDPQASATWCLGLDTPDGGTVKRLVTRRRALDELMVKSPIKKLRVVPADLSLRRLDLRFQGTGRPSRQLGRLLAKMGRRFDLVVVDTPPGAGVVTDSLPVLADLILVPTQPTPISLRTVDVIEEQLGASSIVRVFFNAVDPRKPSHMRMIEETRGRADILASYVPESSAIERLAAEREPTVLSCPDSAAAKSLARLWSEASELLG